MKLKIEDTDGNTYDFNQVVQINVVCKDDKYSVFIECHRSKNAFDYSAIKFFTTQHELEALLVKSSLDALIDLLK